MRPTNRGSTAFRHRNDCSSKCPGRF